ncbi:MAG TPA: hypothetical protein VFD42_04115, partial [Chloroflexota bacterium]|nr:hypothetical protein [Chloroflexota bacterium]
MMVDLLFQLVAARIHEVVPHVPQGRLACPRPRSVYGRAGHPNFAEAGTARDLLDGPAVGVAGGEVHQ